jgi:integrase
MSKRQPRPYFVKARSTWYVQFGKKQVNLGKDESAAFRQYHKLMLVERPVPDDADLTSVVDLYLEWLEANRAANTFKGAKYWIERWRDDLLKKHPSGLKVCDMKPLDLSRWADETFKGKSSNSKHTAMRTIMRCFSWAKKQRIITADPTDGVELPSKFPREIVITEEEWAAVMRHAKGEEFRDLLTVLRETGCRPFEVFTVTNKEFDRKNRRWVFERRSSKGKKYNRVQYLTDTVFILTAKWAMRYPEGPIFRNRDGNPWNSCAVQSRVSRLVKHIGFRFMPYALRHTFFTEGLANGVDAVVLAELGGHRDLTMVARTYGHLAKKHEFLRASLDKALTNCKRQPKKNEDPRAT